MAEKINILEQGDYNNWADIVIKIWKQKLIKYKVGAYRGTRKVTTESLFNSFINHIYTQAGGDAKRIEFFFNKYGIYVENGVGREVSKGNPHDLPEYATRIEKNKSKHLQRRRKPWFSKTWYSEVIKLQKHLLEQIGETAVKTLLLEFPEFIEGQMGSTYKPKKSKKPKLSMGAAYNKAKGR